MVLSDREIVDRALSHNMIYPFLPTQVKELNGQRIVSAGVSSYGYDMRVAGDFRVFKTTYMPVIDPKNFDARCFDTVTVGEGEAVIIPPNSFMLARSVEYFKIPRDILAIVTGKSTYARCGLIVNVTPLEPEWEGQVTIEISNTTPLPAKVYAFEGVAQVFFIRGSEVCGISYADKDGKYQGQRGVVLPRM
jgi:dCTP deaminase